MKTEYYNELMKESAIRYKVMYDALHDIAHASNHDELMKAILKHKDVLRECM